MGDQLDENSALINNLDSKVQEMNSKFEMTNTKLKTMVDSFRPCHKICIDITLVTIFLVMLGILYNVITKSY